MVKIVYHAVEEAKKLAEKQLKTLKESLRRRKEREANKNEQ